ncbi:SUN domain-containing protein 1-like isoform X1 [Dreissena polymorpha]|uniref:SUN domain-containing protein n=2 Tax=Dreissena polymorpha TaxID=45954 RepID=A0A9D4LQ98_DREPO|nr:SUN domain-containing protein 1-like isoform X1 [Dreissena polymorpha]KAH3862071.1 hypothetical protein DPMN_025030 [Dreissena polymorpha]
MRRISPMKRHKRAANRQTKREETIVGKQTYTVIQKTPTTSYENYLQDERWDILPKTDYTYAKSGSYSPRFFGRKYVNPNMSRYRIHGRRQPVGGEGGGQHVGGEISSEEDDELLYGEYMEYSDEDKDLDDSQSDVSYERVLVDGMSLRSGKSLHSMREILHEHDAKLQQSEMINSTTQNISTSSSLVTSLSRAIRSAQKNTNENAISKSTIKKGFPSKANSKHYSQSDRKAKDFDGDVNVNKYNQTTNVRPRRNLNTDFSNSAALETVNNSARNVRRESGASYDEIDSGNSRSGYSVRTVTKTVTEEYNDLDHGFPEKGSMEASEKQANARRNSKQVVKNNIKLYGLDSEGEFSDSSTSYTHRSGYSNGRSGSSNSTSSSSSSSTVSSIITTITETISTVTNPIVKPLWKHVGQPVTTHVCRPILQTITTVVTAVISLIWLLLWVPVTSLVKTLARALSWMFRGELLNTAQKGAVWMWEQLEYISWKFTTLDVWLFQRRRRCCVWLPLLLLLPVLLAILTGFRFWEDSSIFVGMFGGQKQAPQVIINEKHEHYSQLNEDVRNMIFQMQTSSRSQLTMADVEAIVYRILNKESTLLKADIEDSRIKDHASQCQWKTEQEQKFGDMKQKQDDLLLNIQALEAAIAAEKSHQASLEGTQQSKSAELLAGLEARLAALQGEMTAHEEKYAALLAIINDCCKNETFYAALVKDNVDIVFAQLMSGEPSDNPSHTAFTEWLQAKYVSKEAVDARLKDLSVELTASMVAMIKDLQAQKQAEASTTASVLVVDSHSGIGEQEVRVLIEEALLRFSADKTGQADFALESAGGSIVSTRCSETFYRKTALVSVLGIPLWYTSNSPRTIIQPEVYPGQCWAFRGKQGYIVIQTSILIIPTGFTLEHIPKSLAPSGKIDSAPKEFTVLGLESEHDEHGLSLGNFTYSDNGKPIQFFPVQLKEEISPFVLYELRILGNHGNEEYTCLYRFRIHGKPYKKQ